MATAYGLMNSMALAELESAAQSIRRPRPRVKPRFLFWAMPIGGRKAQQEWVAPPNSNRKLMPGRQAIRGNLAIPA